MQYVFDGSFNGFLCCVFESFERKETEVIPVTQELLQPMLYQQYRTIETVAEKAARVRKGLLERCGKANFDFYTAFLSEDSSVWRTLFELMQHIFRNDSSILQNFGNPVVLHFSQTLKKIGRERHRMQAFIRFKKTSDGMYVATIEPDFNVLPLIADFFRKRYADQPWLIYDAKRQYGLLYDLKQVTEVNLLETGEHELSTHPAIELDEKELAYEQLWKTYFTHTNIVSRKNTKLHLRHVPKRYWKYLTEKQ